ncbi:MAG TPA: MBL fold metallo-hydrolase [Vicinamibacteria bacterium]|nr:MBL fold metallo-hydrolase [Vicinamibacteria bacterium]
MHVVFLGSGNAFASGARNHMAILLRSRAVGVLLDCGPTTLVALKREGLSPADVDVVLVSHLHGDHFGGIPMLAVHERHVSQRRKPLQIFGPPGTRATVGSAIELFFPGLDGPPFEHTDVAPGAELEVGALRFLPFEVDHFSTGMAYGYRVEMDGKSVVFSGDTAWTDALVAHTAGADLFICECSSYEAPLPKHMSHTDLKRNRARLEAKRTLLVHAGEDVIARKDQLTFELAQDGTRIEL